MQAEDAGPAGEFDRQLFERRLRSHDPTLLDNINTQTTPADKLSLLALHNACRETHGRFQYLEIGSHLGGSLQVLFADRRCTSIVSIDSRPPSQTDSRGRVTEYPGNTTERMLANLERVPGADLGKLRTIEASTEDLDPEEFRGTAQLCFIDAEHTHGAALRDARFCRTVVDGQGAIVFHDSGVVNTAIREFLGELYPRPFTSYTLPHLLAVVELGRPRLFSSDRVQPRVEEKERRRAAKAD